MIFGMFLLEFLFIPTANVHCWQGKNDTVGNGYGLLYHTRPNPTEQNSDILSKAYKLQVPFIENKGQIESEAVKYYAKTLGGTVFITEDAQIVYFLPDIEKGKEIKGWVIKESFGGGSTSHVKGEQKSATKINCFKGQDSSKWTRQIGTYNIVNLGWIDEGIALKLKAYGKNIEKLFYVSAGGNPERIKINIDGANCLKVSENGELNIETGLGVVKFTKPIAYQQEDGKKKYVDVAYVVNACQYGFKVGDYDNKKELVIDPLLASTYLGGGDSEHPCTIAIGSNNSVYVAGPTMSSNFPTTTGAYHITSGNAFISKFDANLENLLASTYIDANCVWSIAIDTSGNPYVTGWTCSPNFPTTDGAYDRTLNGYNDAFISKFDANLENLLASTYLGGSRYNCARSIGMDKSGNVYVTGETKSSDFPVTPGAYDTAYNGEGDVFVSKFDGDLKNLLASTYIGGSGCDWGYSIDLDNSGNVYLAGATSSSDFPVTPGAYDNTYNGGCYDAFVSKLDGNLQTVLAATYLGGSVGYEYARSMSIDSTGNVYITGSTSSSDFPVTPGAYDGTFNGKEDVFVSKFDENLKYLLASTYLGGSGCDFGYSIDIDHSGNVYLAGATSSSDFPVTPGAYDTIYNGGRYDAFVSKLDGNLQTVLAASYLGDTGDYDHTRSIIIDNTGNVYVTGICSSSDFPVTPAVYDTTYNGGRYDVFVSRFDSDLSRSEPSAIKVPADYTTIQAAIIAAKDGDTIQVAQGVYAENITITSSKHISIQGGWSDDFASRSSDNTLTVIDGGGKGQVVYISPVLGAAVNLSLEGFTIKNGAAENGGGICAVANGAGTWIMLTLNRCAITDNASTDNGGGFNLEAIQGSLVANIIYSTISSNRTKLFGGGLRLNAFMGGSATLNMVNDRVQDNIAEEVDGGGIAVYGAKAGLANLNLSNTIVTRNQGPNGGGVFGYAWGQDAVVLMTLKNNLITHNSSQQGGAICSCAGVTDPTFSEAGGSIIWDLTNNTLTANSAGTAGGAGGIRMSSGSIYGNGGSSSLNLKNDIAWGNTDSYGNQQVVVSVDGKSGTSNAKISYSTVGLIQTIGEGQCSTDHVINQNPGFKNAAGGDYHLTESSPCIDTGTSAGAPTADIEGVPRPQGNGYDMGAYEYAVVPVLDIKANSQDGPIRVTPDTPVSITASLAPGEQNGTFADWWLVFNSPWGLYSLTSNGWDTGIKSLAAFPLFSIPPVEIFNGYLPAGDYAFYFGVDMSVNGILDLPLYYDFVQISVVN